MITLPALARAHGLNPRTVRKAAERLGIPKPGRDYYLTDEQAAAVLAAIQPGPGRPRKVKP